MSKGYAGISAPKIEILEWYVKKGGKAGFFHDLPTDVQIRLQMGYVHELLEQDVNRWLQDHGHNPHMEPPDWLAAEEYEVDVYGPYGGRYTGTIREKEKNAESFGVDSADVEEEPCPHCNGEGSCEWCDGEGCRHCGYVEGDCEWCGGTGFEAESKLHPGLYRYKGKIGMRKGWTECQECDDIVKQKDVNWYYIKGYGQATVCDACVGKYNYKKDRLSKGQRHGELAILLMQKEDEEMGAESFNADEIEETDQEIAESVLFSCDDCDSIYGGGEGEVLICSRLGQKGHYNHCENCCSGSETFSAERDIDDDVRVVLEKEVKKLFPNSKATIQNLKAVGKSGEPHYGKSDKEGKKQHYAAGVKIKGETEVEGLHTYKLKWDTGSYHTIDMHIDRVLTGKEGLDKSKAIEKAKQEKRNLELRKQNATHLLNDVLVDVYKHFGMRSGYANRDGIDGITYGDAHYNTVTWSKSFPTGTDGEEGNVEIRREREYDDTVDYFPSRKTREQIDALQRELRVKYDNPTLEISMSGGGDKAYKYGLTVYASVDDSIEFFGSESLESFSAEYRPKWKEEKKHHRSNPTYTCSFQIREYNRGEYEGEYEEHKLQIQKVKGKWVVHELDTRYVTPNARLIKDRYNKEEYWRPISDPYDTVDEAKKSVVEEITQSKCQHDDGYRLADPTQIFYDSHEYVDFVCVKCGAIGYGDMGENDFRGIDTRWAEGEESKWVKISAILTQDYFADLKEGDESWNDVEWEIDTYDQREKAIFGQGAVGQSWDETIRYNRDAESFAASWPFSKRKKQERIIGRIGGEYGPIWDEKKYDGERWEDVGRLYQDKEQLFKVLGTDKCSVCENKLFHNYRKYDPSDAYRKYDPSDSNPPVICGNCFSEETKKSDIYYENPRKPGQGVIRRPAEKKVFHPVDGLNPPCSCKYCQYNLDFVKRLKDGHPLIDSTFDKYSRCLWCEHKYEDDDRLDRLMAFHQPAPHEPYVVCDRCYEYEETDKEWDETIRYNRDAESFATEGRTFKCGGCWRELPLKERSRKRKESMGQEEMCRPCMKMSDADYVDSLIEQGGMDEYDRVVKELYGDWDLRFNEPEICSVCGERGGHICFEAESFSAPYPRKKGDYYNRCNDCDGDILEDQYQRETTYTRQYCVDSKRGKSTCGMDEEWEETEESYAESTDRVFPSKAVEAKADLALIGAGAIVGLLIGGIIVRDR